MFRLASTITIIRRVLLVVLILLLLPHYIGRWSTNKGWGINDPLQALKADGGIMTEIPIGQSFKIDDDTFTAETVYVTSKQILMTYTYRVKQTHNAWSFPAMSLKLVTPDGQQLDSRDAGSHGTSSGSRGYIAYSLPDLPVDHATIVYDWYDRKAQLDISLVKAGEGE
ncbi:hypothetical protein PaecuDRAFT_0012 [Paenibacillus curdlanolyticus YK9]|uniref:DUF5643 domain-containing protein n=1 Tax=Paenibacillus curdlanolyticus YK9 TaxID=717606 RepID=E0I4H0_9BACL|nr:hypothetical protein [Paenibacillus curdlanolyticus]EFM12501.1 hypothetical protein PaecuDRAFT_0012 [Paenibacillus curdlanolyticus YK9]